MSSGRLKTPVATVDAPALLAADATVRNLGPWRGVEWHHESGDGAALRERTGRSVSLSVGHTPRTGHVVVEYRLNVINKGWPVRREVMAFRYPVAATP